MSSLSVKRLNWERSKCRFAEVEERIQPGFLSLGYAEIPYALSRYRGALSNDEIVFTFFNVIFGCSAFPRQTAVFFVKRNRNKRKEKQKCH